MCVIKFAKISAIISLNIFLVHFFLLSGTPITHIWCQDNELVPCPPPL